jgi:cytochrome c5
MPRLTPLFLTLCVAALAGCSKQDNPTTPAPAVSSNAPSPAPEPTPAPSAMASPQAAASSSASGDTAVAAAGTSGANPASASAGGSNVGQQVYSQTCVACHGAGVAGAPKIGDKSDWGPRIAQGKDTLYAHALQGFTGKKGTMPPKGGSPRPDADSRAAVDYMVSQAK